MKAKEYSFFKNFLSNRRKRIETVLHKELQKVTRNSPKKLADAMEYTTLGGGKRLRSLLVYAIGEIYGANIKSLDAPACAVELIHSFSLIHDDLPAMDNSSLRRGKPTCHIAFSEATAILTGNVLAISAFQILNNNRTLSAEKKALMSKVLAEASGATGMAGGQYLDLQLSGIKPNKNWLEKMYLLKTGALISAAVKLGALASSINKQKLGLLEQFALNLGLAFQIQDDILDIESSSKILGKCVGIDNAQNKITYPALVGTEGAKIKVAKLWNKMQKILYQLKTKDNVLHSLTSYIMQRRF